MQFIKWLGGFAADTIGLLWSFVVTLGELGKAIAVLVFGGVVVAACLLFAYVFLSAAWNVLVN
jgi:hypothetical protein